MKSSLLKYVSLADVGKAIHPVLCEGQDEGGVMNAIGHSLIEEMIYKDGQLLNPNLVDYRVPTFQHLPKDFETILVESQNGPGPFGSKGTGEGGLLPVAAAIGNAVYRATGLRFYDLPLTPEKVWTALTRKRPAFGLNRACSFDESTSVRRFTTDTPYSITPIRSHDPPLISSISRPSGNGTFNILSNKPQ